MSFNQVNNMSFPNEEKLTLNEWNKNKNKNKNTEKNNDLPEFRFMDGPPFVSANNFHYGHVLVGSIKDIINRYKTMKGFKVLNKLGYDCHGLPIEMKANEVLNINTKQDVMDYGIDKYNQKCRELIKTFSGSWSGIYDRMARKHDSEDEYRTMDTSYMESTWWVFKQLWDKDLVYKGSKIMPYSTKCTTPLSNFEAGQAYKNITDISVYTKLCLINTSDINNNNTYFLVWTTTPWTLPMNMALCVNPDLTYVKINDLTTNENYILAESTIKSVYKKNKKYKIIEKYNGTELTNFMYKPPFNYYDYLENNKYRKVISDKFVTSDSGTGIVHLSPAFGEEDLKVCIKNNIITEETLSDVCPINEDGYFTKHIEMFEGKYFKNIDVDVIRYLKTNNMLFKQLDYNHSYPHCWRTDTPLMYRPVSSYFIKVTAIKEDLINNNKKVNWVPGHVGEKRFGEWIGNVRDWCVSRSRYFGTPIPIWVSDNGNESICVGSIKELVELAELDYVPDDLHKEFIDSITIKSKNGNGILRRIPDIFDCWFESGCVPYAQNHYSTIDFSNQEYLSDFVCEGIDQTRGWFYTLMVLSTALFNKPAFKNVICTGLVLAEDGKKMSKSKQNYTPINEVFDKYGSDALRLYLTNSPAACADSVKFNDKDLQYTLRSPIQLFNGLKFFIEQVTKYEKDGNIFNYELNKNLNVIDKWILSRIDSTIKSIDNIMDKYEVFRIKDVLFNFINDITNVHIKFRRNAFKGKLGKEEQEKSLTVLYIVLLQFSKISAPFMPFFSEYLYNKLKNTNSSVHDEKYPESRNYLDEVTERKMRRLLKIVDMSRSLRSKSKLASSVKKPLNHITIFSDDDEYINDLNEFYIYLNVEINSINIYYKNQKEYITYTILPNKGIIGKKYKKDAKFVTKAINDLSNEQIYENLNNEYIILELENGKTININKDDEYKISINNNYKYKDYELVLIDEDNMLMINYEETEEVMNKYMTKLFVRSVQELREESGLHPWDKIEIYYKTNNNLSNAIKMYKDNIENDLMYKIYEDNMQYNINKIISTKKCKYTENNIIDITITSFQSK